MFEFLGRFLFDLQMFPPNCLAIFGREEHQQGSKNHNILWSMFVVAQFIGLVPPDTVQKSGKPIAGQAPTFICQNLL